MVIYLKHPKHGTKVACSDEEAKYDESNGWTRYTVGQVESPAEAVPVAVGTDVRGTEANSAENRGDRGNVEGAVGGGRGTSPQAAVDAIATDAGPTLQDLRAQYKEKFGKAAHAKKKAETLKKELA